MQCLFKQCNWIYIGNGIYQCTNCKTISMGANRDKKQVENDISNSPNGGHCETQDEYFGRK